MRKTKFKPQEGDKARPTQISIAKKGLKTIDLSVSNDRSLSTQRVSGKV